VLPLTCAFPTPKRLLQSYLGIDDVLEEIESAKRSVIELNHFVNENMETIKKRIGDLSGVAGKVSNFGKRF